MANVSIFLFVYMKCLNEFLVHKKLVKPSLYYHLNITAHAEVSGFWALLINMHTQSFPALK